MGTRLNPRNWNKIFPNKNVRDVYLRAIEFKRLPSDWIPCSVSIFGAVWQKYRKDLVDVVKRHPFVFGTFLKRKFDFDSIPSRHQAGAKYNDNWGCTWQVAKGGYEGQVIGHPLADWNALDIYQFPDPLKFTERGKRHWTGLKLASRWALRSNVLRNGGCERLFDRLYFLRGFDNLMMDIAGNHPKLPTLVQRLQDHEMMLVNNYLDIGVDSVSFHTDIGMQDRLMISPRQFRKHIKPMFSALFQRARQAGVHVYLSSDGHLLEIVDDLIECGVSVHDPQERANTLDGIKHAYKGKLCIDLDLDRQAFPFLSPGESKEHVLHAVDVLGSDTGGLMLKAEIGDTNIPLENIEAICSAYEVCCIP